MLSTVKSVILIALAVMLTIANSEARPNPCAWEYPIDAEVRSYRSTQKRCQLLIHPCAVRRRQSLVYHVEHRDRPLANSERRVL